MKYTYQEISGSGSFSNPEGTDIETASSLAELRRALERWQDSHSRVGSDEQYVQLMVWKGYHEDVTDLYPDFILRSGPRLGVVRESC